MIQRWYCKEKLDAGHSQGLKGELLKWITFVNVWLYNLSFLYKLPTCTVALQQAAMSVHFLVYLALGFFW